MVLHFVASAAGHRILVTLTAGIGVEQRAEPGLGSERALEDLTAAIEPVALVGRQPGYRVAGHGTRRAGAKSAQGIDRGECHQSESRRLHGCRPWGAA